MHIPMSNYDLLIVNPLGIVPTVQILHPSLEIISDTHPNLV